MGSVVKLMIGRVRDGNCTVVFVRGSKQRRRPVPKPTKTKPVPDAADTAVISPGPRCVRVGDGVCFAGAWRVGRSAPLYAYSASLTCAGAQWVERPNIAPPSGPCLS